MTHTSGLRPDLDLGEAVDRLRHRDRARRSRKSRRARPAQRFVYSDINYFLLGDIVRRVSGQPLDEFAQQDIFEPLGHEGHDVPAAGERCGRASRRPRTARRSPGRARGRRRRCCAASSTIRRRGGWAASPATPGLFSTAADLAIFCRMLLDGGAYNGARDPLAADGREDDEPGDRPAIRNVRGLGWDIDSSYSSNRGELLPLGSFGHTGFTGTSLWIDPATGMFVVFLSNRVHPDGKGDVTPLRARVATIAASAITRRSRRTRRGAGLDRPRLRPVRPAAAAAAARAGA